MHLNRLAGAIAALTLLATPAIASAHGTGSKGHHRHHARHHQASKAQTREVTGPATATVTAFTGGELTITLANGKSYSGLVSDRTILTCDTAAPQSTTARAARHGGDDPAGDDRGNGGGGQGQGDDDAQGAGSQGDHSQSDDNSQADDDAHDQGDDNGNGACGTDALTAGTKVSNAELSLKGTDATWKKVELVK